MGHTCSLIELDVSKYMSFEPKFSAIFDFLIGIIGWITEAVNNLKSCESDLVPFMEIPKDPIF